jgi:pimeloyl-ACP methyl ester carboxylesterase
MGANGAATTSRRALASMLDRPVKHRKRWLLAPLLLVSVLAACAWLEPRLVAAGLLLRMEGAKAGPAWLAHYGEHVVDERPFRHASGVEGVLYTPRDAAQAPGLVLAHGIHEDGIRDARMVAFARAVASSGVVVLTPVLVDLAHYRVTHAGAERIAESARVLAEHLHTERVSVFGVSFGGGLALRAACEPELRGAIARVITLGAHHDAAFVSRFFLGESALGPDGKRAPLKPHGYGATVLFQSLFAEKHKGAITLQDKMRVERALSEREQELRDASPASCPGSPEVPLYLVHGLGDRIIPYTESLWNAQQFGPRTPVTVLVSPAIVHAEYAPPTLRERLDLVSFMAAALN